MMSTRSALFACSRVADVAPGVAGVVLDHPDQQQGEPAQLDVRADPVFAVVEDRAQVEGTSAPRERALPR